MQRGGLNKLLFLRLKRQQAGTYRLLISRQVFPLVQAFEKYKARYHQRKIRSTI